MRSLLVLIAACGGGSSPPVVASGPPAAMIAPGSGPDDVIVANVEGRPVWGSCIAMQVKATPGKTKQVAFDECVSFELLAQAAEKKGLDRHHETIDATRTALVARLVDQFAARTTSDALRAKIDELYQPVLFNAPERRASWHVVVVVPQKNATDAEHATAKQLADKIHEAIKDEIGLLPPQFEDLVKRVATGSKPELVIQAYRPIAADHAGTDVSYRDALFAITDVGRVSPVTKSQFGYHVILLAERHAPVALDRVAAGPIIHANLQRRMFDEFLAGVVAKSGIRAQQFPEVLDRLAQEPK